MGELSGCWEKLSRADELTDALERELDRVLSKDHVRFGLGGEDAIELVVEVRRQPPWDRWGVLIGEVVHDLRSALDHAAWTLTVAHRDPPPDPPTGWWRRVEFPIFTDPDLFRTDGIKVDLYGVDPSVIAAAFEWLQPFRRAPRRPERHPLAILHALSIRDKHRALPLAAIVGRGGTITAVGGGFRGRSRARRILAPIPDRAVVARLSRVTGTAAPAVGDVVTIAFNVHVDVAFAFAPGPPAFGGEIIPTLRALRRATARALHRLEAPRLF